MELSKAIVCTFLLICNLQLITGFKVTYQPNYQDNAGYNYEVSFLFSLKEYFYKLKESNESFWTFMLPSFQAAKSENNEYKWENEADSVDTVCYLFFVVFNHFLK